MEGGEDLAGQMSATTVGESDTGPTNVVRDLQEMRASAVASWATRKRSAGRDHSRSRGAGTETKGPIAEMIAAGGNDRTRRREAGAGTTEGAEIDAIHGARRDAPTVRTLTEGGTTAGKNRAPRTDLPKETTTQTEKTTRTHTTESLSTRII